MFKTAIRKSVKLKIALTGPSGSGKTYSSLLLASGLGKKIALVDTENSSASLYAGLAGLPQFDSLELSPPYLVNKYTSAIKEAEKLGYDVLVIDSISHAWAGEGGLLQKKESLDATGKGNSYTNWAAITKEQEIFKAAMLNAGIHLVCTVRSKQDYSQETDEKGKKVIVKVGLAPVQRDGIEYEFTTVFDLSMKHEYLVSKDRTGLFDGRIEKITKKTGEEFVQWLNGAHREEAKENSPVSSPRTEGTSDNSQFENGPDFDYDEEIPSNFREAPQEKNPLEDKILDSGPMNGMTFKEALRIDSSHDFKIAKWAFKELKKDGNKVNPVYKFYIQYALSEGVALS